MAIYEKQIKRAPTILAELQAIDPGITDMKMSGTDFTIRTSTILAQPQIDLLLAYSPYTLVQEQESDVASLPTKAVVPDPNPIP